MGGSQWRGRQAGGVCEGRLGSLVQAPVRPSLLCMHFSVVAHCQNLLMPPGAQCLPAHCPFDAAVSLCRVQVCWVQCGGLF